MPKVPIVKRQPPNPSPISRPATSSSSKNANAKSNRTATSATPAVDGEDDADDLNLSAGAGEGKMIDKSLVLRLIIAKLEASKKCDWFGLSVALQKEGIRASPSAGIGGKGKGKGAKGKAKKGKAMKEDDDEEYDDDGGDVGKGGREGEGAGYTGAELHDLFHLVRPATTFVAVLHVTIADRVGRLASTEVWSGAVGGRAA